MIELFDYIYIRASVSLITYLLRWWQGMELTCCQLGKGRGREEYVLP